MTLGVNGAPAMMVVLLCTIFAPTISSFAALVETKPLSATLLFPLAPTDTSNGFDVDTPLYSRIRTSGFVAA
jgi:hypothetical protein